MHCSPSTRIGAGIAGRPGAGASLGDAVLREGHQFGGADREVELDGEDGLTGVATFSKTAPTRA